MKQSIRLGRIGGVPVGVHWSVAAIFALVTWQLATTVFPDAYGLGGRPVYWVAGAVTAALFFVSLLAHEGAHAVVARHHGVGVRSITLWLFGGVAQLEGEAPHPRADFAIAAVGPGTSVALAGVFAAAQALLEQAGAHGLVVGVSSWLWQINLLLAGFNLIPAAPLDGGRILRAGLWKVTGNRVRAAVLAARAGSGFGIVLIGLGLVEFATGSPFGPLARRARLVPLQRGPGRSQRRAASEGRGARHRSMDGGRGHDRTTSGRAVGHDSGGIARPARCCGGRATAWRRWWGRQVGSRGC